MFLVCIRNLIKRIESVSVVAKGFAIRGVRNLIKRIESYMSLLVEEFYF